MVPTPGILRKSKKPRQHAIKKELLYGVMFSVFRFMLMLRSSEHRKSSNFELPKRTVATVGGKSGRTFCATGGFKYSRFMVFLAHVPIKKDLALLSEKVLFHRYMGQRHHEPVLFEVPRKRPPLNMCPVLWPEIRHRYILT